MTRYSRSRQRGHVDFFTFLAWMIVAGAGVIALVAAGAIYGLYQVVWLLLRVFGG